MGAAVPRSGLTRASVVDAVVRLADADGLEQVTLVRLAEELKVRPPSLFNHIDGLADLRRELQLRALREMVNVASRAAVGRAGSDAVLATAVALRQFAHEHPGLHAASLPSVPTKDKELSAAAQDFVGIFFDIVREYGFKGKEVVHAVRGLFSIIHGFIMLERAGNFGMPIDIDESFRWLVERYVESLNVGRRGRSSGRFATRPH
jgi:AcrR family transcriptional regulator